LKVAVLPENALVSTGAVVIVGPGGGGGDGAGDGAGLSPPPPPQAASATDPATAKLAIQSRPRCDPREFFCLTTFRSFQNPDATQIAYIN
jgi:hypothetical protein